jgi:hypothetical protein
MTYPGGYVASEVLTAANMNLLPGGSKGQGYAQVISGSGAVGTTVTDLAGLSITFTAVAGRRYKITAQALLVKSTGAASDSMNIYIRDAAGTPIATSQVMCYGVGITHTLSIGVSTVPGAGAVTYKLSFNTSSTNPAWILVEDIGPS